MIGAVSIAFHPRFEDIFARFRWAQRLECPDLIAMIAFEATESESTRNKGELRGYRTDSAWEEAPQAGKAASGRTLDLWHFCFDVNANSR
jgi:hypothetical protein